MTSPINSTGMTTILVQHFRTICILHDQVAPPYEMWHGLHNWTTHRQYIYVRKFSQWFILKFLVLAALITLRAGISTNFQCGCEIIFDIHRVVVVSRSRTDMDSPLSICAKKRRAVIRMLWTETVTGAEIHCRLSVQYGCSALPQRGVYKWAATFKNDRTSVTWWRTIRAPVNIDCRGGYRMSPCHDYE
jgi:hypothetical protein